MSGTRAISTKSRRELSSSFFSCKVRRRMKFTPFWQTLTCFIPGWAKDLSAPLYVITAFAQVVVAESYTVAMRIPTLSCPDFLNTFQISSYASRRVHLNWIYLSCKYFLQYSSSNGNINYPTYLLLVKFYICYFPVCGPGSSVGIATDYWLDGPGSNSGGNEIFRPSRPVLGPTQPPVKWVAGLYRIRGGRGVGLTPPLPFSAKVLERVELYFYSP